MKYKNEIIFIYHLLAIFMLFALLLIDFTGILAHEILAVIFIGIILILHVVFCFKAYKNAFIDAFKNKKQKSIAKVCVIIVVLIVIVLQIISGIVLSRYIFPHASTINYFTWLRMHRWVSRIMLALFVALMALFLKDVVMLAKTENNKEF